METITRTATGALLQTNHLLNLPTIIGEHSTLNEKFGIQQDVTISESDKPSVNYVTIGNGGHRVVIGVNDIPKIEAVQHKAKSAALYNHLPFILRLPNDDLSPTDRAKYRLRRTEVHGGTTYVAYYLKVIDKTDTQSVLELRSVIDGVTTSVPFTHTLADLSPVPPEIPSEGVVVTTGDYIAATAKVPFFMSETDITEFLNVANIIYGDEGYAIISEFALCSGIDKVVTGDFGGVSTGYTEAIAVQIVSFVSSFFPAKFNNSVYDVLLDVGSVEIMLDI